MRDKFMREILANLDDPAPRLVYADWLEEQGDDQRAAYYRNLDASKLYTRVVENYDDGDGTGDGWGQDGDGSGSGFLNMNGDPNRSPMGYGELNSDEDHGDGRGDGFAYWYIHEGKILVAGAYGIFSGEGDGHGIGYRHGSIYGEETKNRGLGLKGKSGKLTILGSENDNKNDLDQEGNNRG
ncbi:MAG: TIGR02996 domain-containing protein [Planctomycetales bacterium]